MTRQEFNPEKYNPISIYTREHGNIGSTGYRLPEKEKQLLDAISIITYPVNSPAYDEAVKRAARRTGNTVFDARNVAYNYQKAVDESQKSPSQAEMEFAKTIGRVKSALGNMQQEIDDTFK